MCDRMFNSMKQQYHHRNIYTLEDTYKILNLDDKVTVNRTTFKTSMIGIVFFKQFKSDPKQVQLRKAMFSSFLVKQ